VEGEEGFYRAQRQGSIYIEQKTEL